MATCSSILAWSIPCTEEPGGLQSIGSHRVWHDWSDLTATHPLVFYQFSSVQFSHQVWFSDSKCLTLCDPMDCSTPGSLSITNFRSLYKLMSIESVMPSNHLTLCRPLLFPPSVFSGSGLFEWVSSLHQVAKGLEFQLQHQSFQWIFRTDFL